ncbi:Rossmann fold nucleotide-binding protein Smf possibly involved in DNA uptake [hydrothermal vent metagenome]|uniref:Rossmann fold nucleotide-binding protein Smf possibly involved in DNA uptake n=1 Tax=hydrothermal vent metagenome TaxID=652676 RepID=A0A3B0RQD3_9ZZZZ
MSQLQSLSHAELRDWLRLSRTPGVGPVTFRDLIYRFNDAAIALTELPRLARRGGRIKTLEIPTREQAEAELDALHEIGGRMLPCCDPDFPLLLAAIDPPPPILSVLGDVSILQQKSCAMVGSRNASAIGMRFARQLAGELGQAGVVVVSGLARGIDGAAHAGALDNGTIAVVAGGVDHVYPSQHAELRQDILETGAVVSERRLGHRATARDFPRRNRIISGLSLGTIVIEAAKRSGSLITARYALEQNREVFAAPGSPLDPRTSGANGLIRQGAILIENVEDILEVLDERKTPDLSEQNQNYTEPPLLECDEAEIDQARDRILQLLSPSPIARDELVRLSGFSAAACTAALVELDLAGKADSLPGGMVAGLADLG